MSNLLIPYLSGMIIMTPIVKSRVAVALLTLASAWYLRAVMPWSNSSLTEARGQARLPQLQPGVHTTGKQQQKGQTMTAPDNFTEKQQKAFTLLAEMGIKPSSYNPPLIRLLGRMGFAVRPPHFMSFWLGLLVFGVYFGLIWGLFMWLFVWQSQTMSWPDVGSQTGMVGGGFGLLMAGWYQFQRRKLNLPRWEDL